jgi:hypothetical protein
MNVNEAASQFRVAQENYDKSFRAYFANEVTSLPDDRFWQLQSVFVGEVASFRFGYGRTNGVEQAARELFRKPLASDFNGRGNRDVPRYSMHEAIQFAKSWRELTRRLYQPLFDVIEDRSDDAYGDLLDALPLAGRDVVQKLLGREFANQDQFEQTVRDACKECPQMAELTLRGENYVGMSLMDAAREYFAIE